jgi:hypothetical protein
MRVHEQKHSKNPIYRVVSVVPSLSSIPSPESAYSRRRFRRTGTTTTTAMKRIEREQCRWLCRHARCIPSGRHGHMRTGRPQSSRLAAAMAARETCICHHVNRWGSDIGEQRRMRIPRWKRRLAFVFSSKRPWHALQLAAADPGGGIAAGSRVCVRPPAPLISLSNYDLSISLALQLFLSPGLYWIGWPKKSSAHCKGGIGMESESNFQTRKFAESRCLACRPARDNPNPNSHASNHHGSRVPFRASESIMTQSCICPFADIVYAH